LAPHSDAAKVQESEPRADKLVPHLDVGKVPESEHQAGKWESLSELAMVG
jgi:hypothetical protein